MEALSDREGAFELDWPERECVLDVDTPLWTTVLEPWLGARSGDTCVLVVAPRVPVAGRVVDPQGRPLAAAEIALQGPNLRFELLRDVSQSSDVVLLARSDADGRFELSDAPDLWPGKVVTRRAGFVDDERELFEVQGAPLTIVLRPRERDPRTLVGRVLDPAGAPVEGAYVRTGRTVGVTGAPTNALGEFELAADGPVERLVAFGRGFAPVERELDAASATRPIELRFTAPALSIEGRVLDGEDRPCAGIELEMLDGEPIYDWRDDTGQYHHTVERVLAGTPPGPRDASTDARGRFELSGLAERAYRLRCFDPRTLESIVSEPIEAGSTSIVLRMLEPERTRRLGGRVVDRRGRPVAGAQVRALRPSEYEHRWPGDPRDSLWLGAAQRTDLEGRFLLERVGASATKLWATPRGTQVATQHELEPGGDALGLELVVPRACLVQIDLRGSGVESDFALVEDPNSPSGFVTFPMGRRSAATSGVLIASGRSQAFVVSDRATALVLILGRHADGRSDTRRIPLAPDPDRLTIVRP